MKIRCRPPLPVMLLSIAMLFALACAGGQESTYPIAASSAGQVIYEANCASCHGDATTPPPLALAPPHNEVGHTWHHPDRLLVEWVLDGVPLAQVMPRFRGTLTEVEAQAAVAYIKTFWSAEVVELQTANSAQYESQLAGTPIVP